MALKLEQQLKDLGSKLESPQASSKDSLLKLLKQAATCLSDLDQSPPATLMESMQPFLNAIVKPELLKHQDRDVKLLVASCICEITRITAPEAPYNDDVLKDIFHLIVGTFSGLSDTSGPSFARRVVILETVAKYRSCVVMLDLECDDLINEMFRTFFSVASDEHTESVLSSMQTIMVVLLEESEDVREDLLLILLSMLGRNRTDITSAGRRLAMNVIEHSAEKLEPGIKQFLMSAMSGDSQSLIGQIDCHEVIYDIYRCAPRVLSGVVPYITGELLTDQLDTRLKAVRLVGDIFSLPGCAISEGFQPVFSEFLKRLTDRVVAVRLSVLEHVKSCLLSDPLRPEAPQINSALCDRLLDYDENVRKQVIAVIGDVACHSLSSVPVETVKLVAERLRDKSLPVKKYAIERLAEIYKTYCAASNDESLHPNGFDWITGKILRCLYDKDFRSDTIESVLCCSLFPSEFSIKDVVGQWVQAFSGFDKVEVKALEKILEQKQRLQQEMQRYLSLRQMSQDGDSPEIQKKILFCFRVMSRSFADPAKAEENFQFLDQLKDANVWKILTKLVDPSTSVQQACTLRDDLLRILGERHRLYGFLRTLSVKCSYILFNKEHVKQILVEVAVQKSAGNEQYMSCCMNILVILARFSPLLLKGAEEELVNFLKDDSEVLKEGALHILAKAGGTIREQLADSSSSVDLILERLCLEGSRRQAKFAVHALAAITKDDGLKSLSVLYKRLVDMLKEKMHLPAVLQSLGCIAQTAMPVFETRESEVEEFIKTNILNCSIKVDENANLSWDDRSELCLLKIYGIKALVKSYLPVKDAHLRSGFDGILEMLRNILLFGEVSKDIESSLVDKAHLRLASAKAIIRLSRQWDHKIPVDVFHLTLRTSEIGFSQARKMFLGKVHQYIKDRILDVKYVCAFPFSLAHSKNAEFEEYKQNLLDIIQMFHQVKARQHSTQVDANISMAYPENILPYLIHALAHQLCPDIDECKDVKEYELLYRQLHLFISMLVQKEEDMNSEAVGEKEKESISTILSILGSIKSSEDIIDPSKSKNSHALCDIGLSTVKRIVQKVDELQGLTAPVTLPVALYRPYEKKEGDNSSDNEHQTWLAEENVLSHFESLKLDCDVMVNSDTVEDELLKENEKDGNEVPLGKVIKHLKSQKKVKKGKKSKSTSDEVKNSENSVDILKMVREINLDSLGMSSKYESSNGHEKLSSKKTKVDLRDHKESSINASEASPVPIPKRRRSLSVHSASRTTSKAPLVVPKGKTRDRDSEISVESEEEVPTKKEMVKSTQKTSSFSSELKRKNADWNQKLDMDEKEDKESDLKRSGTPEKIKRTDQDKSSSKSSKKRKRRSISGLAKCTSKADGSHIEELIGCRIKVWWPMDKQYYEGTVKSYDPIKRKHVVLYDDGDVEVLRLEKERWEPVDVGRKPTKRSKSSKASLSAEVSSSQKTKVSGVTRQNKKPVKKVEERSTPKKTGKRGKRGGSKGKISQDSDKESSSLSKDELATKSDTDEMNTGDSEQQLSEKIDENSAGEDTEKEEKLVSKENRSKDHKSSPNQIEGSDEDDKVDSERTVDEDMETDPQDFEVSDEKEERVDELDGVSREEISQAEKSDSEENADHNSKSQGKVEMKSSDRSEADPELCDDEPLSKWKS